MKLITPESTAFTNGVLVCCSHLAKGLEFDAVLVPHADSQNYCDEMDRGLLYIACTRAMHRLSLTYGNALSPFIVPGSNYS
ncbi:MAG TPA: ATP-binding domain-containing protein [Prolixibacteraceae bacterium]|nr:ATP-binding domain-containing protein [Prolixibacteraceae bacterium]